MIYTAPIQGPPAPRRPELRRAARAFGAKPEPDTIRVTVEQLTFLADAARVPYTREADGSVTFTGLAWQTLCAALGVDPNAIEYVPPG